MRSKISYFNPTLFKKNLTRFWPLWGGASALGALAPLYMLVAYLNSGMSRLVGEELQMTSIYYSILQYGIPILSLFYAAVCALAVWHYLYNARSLGLYHALPITRKGLFATNFLSGMAMMLIPYAVTGALAILVTLVIGLFEPVGLLVTILGVLGESFFYFSAATCIIFITGNPFAYAAFYFIFHFLAMGAEYLVDVLIDLFYFGIPFDYDGAAAFLSPTGFLIDNLRVDITYQEYASAEGWVRAEMESVTLLGGWVIAVYVLVGAALLGCAWLLYRNRRSESAGDVIAVGWMKPIFRYGVALCAGLSGGVLLYLIFCKDFIKSQSARPLPMTVCVAIAGIVGYYIASMLLAKSLAVFRRSGKGVLATVVAAAAICFLIAADPFGVERWVPDVDELEAASMSISSSGGYVGADLRGLDILGRALDFQRTILAEKDLLNDRSTDLWEYGYGYVTFTYWIKGKAVMRQYPIPYSEAALSRLESLKMAAALATDPAVQESNIFEPVNREEVVSARLTGGYVDFVRDTVTGEVHGVDLTAEQARKLEAAIRRDIQAGHFGRTLFVTSYRDRRQIRYAGSLQLNYNVTHKHNLDYSYSIPTNPSIHLEISTYCTETVKALESMGVLDATHKLLTEAENEARWNGYAYTEADGEWAY